MLLVLRHMPSLLRTTVSMHACINSETECHQAAYMCLQVKKDFEKLESQLSGADISISSRSSNNQVHIILPVITLHAILACMRTAPHPHCYKRFAIGSV